MQQQNKRLLVINAFHHPDTTVYFYSWCIRDYNGSAINCWKTLTITDPNTKMLQNLVETI